jgi:6-phosphofructokinase 1
VKTRPTLIIAQSGGPTAVMNASVAGVIEAASAANPPLQVSGARFGIEGVLQADYVDLTPPGGADLDILSQTPGAALGSSRYRPTDEEVAAMVLDLDARDVSCLAMIGGNDTAETLHRAHVIARTVGAGLRVVGIPKTIDNDLPGMDHCPGYGSVARYVALAVREAGIDTAAMRKTDPIKVVELMGRNAGWLAATASLGRERPSDAPQLIFLPERRRSLSQMLDEIQQAFTLHGWVVIVMSENQRDDAGQPLGGDEPIYTDPHGHAYYDSPGAFLARAVQSNLGLRARYERPGSLQRTSVMALSSTDVREARQVGADAVRRALAGESDVMVAIQRARPGGSGYGIELTAIPLEQVAHQERLLPDEFIAPSGTDVTEAYLDYARPLIGDPLPPYWRAD